MTEENSLYELDPVEFLRGRISFYQNKIKTYKTLIKQTEEALIALTATRVIPVEGKTKQLSLVQDNQDFSTTHWKPKVFDFLFENTAKYTSEQILVGIDVIKQYQKDPEVKKKAIKTISSCLFQLNKSKQVVKYDNDGRRGFKWSISESGNDVDLASIR